MNANKFYKKLVEARNLYPQWRYGQTVFNTMYDLYPDAAQKYTGTNIDPFYNDDNVNAFIEACFKEIENENTC